MMYDATLLSIYNFILIYTIDVYVIVERQGMDLLPVNVNKTIEVCLQVLLQLRVFVEM